MHDTCNCTYLSVGVPELVQVVSVGRVHAVPHQPGEVPLAGAGEVALEGVRAGVLLAQHVPVVRPEALESQSCVVWQSPGDKVSKVENKFFLYGILGKAW